MFGFFSIAYKSNIYSLSCGFSDTISLFLLIKSSADPTNVDIMVPFIHFIFFQLNETVPGPVENMHHHHFSFNVWCSMRPKMLKTAWFLRVRCR